MSNPKAQTMYAKAVKTDQDPVLLIDWPVRAFLHFLKQIDCLDDFLRESADFTELVTLESVINRLNSLHPTDYVLASLSISTSHKGPEYWTTVHNTWLEISKIVIMLTEQSNKEKL